MKLSPEAWIGYFFVTFGIPFLGLIAWSWVKLRLRKRGEVSAVQAGAGHLVICATLWVYLVLRFSIDVPLDGISRLPIAALLWFTPPLTVLHLYRLKKVVIHYVMKRRVVLFCRLHLAVLAIFWLVAALWR